MNRYLVPIITALLFLAGCSNNVENLSPDAKKQIYKNVQDEISEQTLKGDSAYKTGYLADAINAYEMVNFYENKAVIPLNTISKIKIQAKNNAKHHYDLALKYYKKDKKRALFEFNAVLKNIPEYKETKIFIKKIKQDPKIKKFISKLENSLQQALSSTKQTTLKLQKINNAYTKLREYDLQNPLLKTPSLHTYLLMIKKDKSVQKKKKNHKNKGSKEELAKLLNEGKKNYNNKDLNKALKNFQEILVRYPNNTTALIYVKKIKRQLQTIKSLE